ncbi:Nucleotide-binding universal stress protein, UspA family [Candidatus Electrothrix aarhusensis]|uniref:Nucleotide-binding universal stress protein, UspA family n=1 Tax=Candidatus Electrothrix aarhusensis TaxID=1859131 RepID=A0A3S4T6Q3_9BACT|nr:Nucleotide-binding universal stress protein, UspA family [Candidatus Electrothrix aarhusensis]
MTEHNTRLMGEAEVIALATDGSSYTDGAVQETIFLAQGCGAKIVVLNVIAVDSASVTGLRTSSMNVPQDVADYLDNIKNMAEDSGIECDIVIEESYYRPEKTIVDLAYKHNADVLVMGRHGKRGLLKLLVGSMTSKVIGQGFPQVLVVPHECSIKGERILVATDGSEAVITAVETAINMGKNCSNLREIHILSVASSEDELEKSKALTETVCAQGREQAPSVDFHPLAVVGKPAADVIAKTAEEKEVDMILIGGHGKGLSKLLMGHVTEKVIGKAHCAVLVLDKKKGEEESIPESGE